MSSPSPTVPRGRIALTKVYTDTLESAPEYKSAEKVVLWRTDLNVADLSVGDPEKIGPAHVLVENCDTLVMAKTLVAAGLNPLVLNMASYEAPGGGVEWGCTAQEEELFRRTNYFRALPDGLYPLRKREMVYSPGVTVFKGTDYQPIAPFEVDMLAVSAVQNPRLVDGRLNRDDRILMGEKIDAIFRAALGKNDSLLLSALGCGAYGNPPAEVAGIFRKCTEAYGPYFKVIAFAVLGEPNFGIFHRIISSTA